MCNMIRKFTFAIHYHSFLNFFFNLITFIRAFRGSKKGVLAVFGLSYCPYSSIGIRRDRIFIKYLTGSLLKPNIAPIIAPTIAAFVSVSPPFSMVCFIISSNLVDSSWLSLM